MTYMGSSPGERNADVIRQSTAENQKRLQAEADAREQAREGRPGLLSRILRRRSR